MSERNGSAEKRERPASNTTQEPNAKRPRVERKENGRSRSEPVGKGEGLEDVLQRLLQVSDVSPEVVQKEWEKLQDEVRQLRNQVGELKMQESTFVLRLSTKEQEIHQLQSELLEYQNKAIPSHPVKSTLIDPTANILFQRMRDELDNVKMKLKKSQEDLSAASFTRESAAGRQLLNRIRLLQKENEELGEQLGEGSTHKLELEISLQRELVEELKKTLEESNEFVLNMDQQLNIVASKNQQSHAVQEQKNKSQLIESSPKKNLTQNQASQSRSQSQSQTDSQAKDQKQNS